MLRGVLLIWGVMVLGLSGLLSVVRQSPSTASLIAYAAYPPGIRDTQIYRVLSDGSDRRLLTFEGGDHTQLSWSQDGRWLAYQQAQLFAPSQATLKVINVTGRQAYTLMKREGVYGFVFDWSPDSREIMVEPVEGAYFEVYTVTGGQRSIPATSQGVYPAWSPDMQWIAFIDNGLRVMRADGSAAQLIAPVGFAQTLPRWSPDGAWIVFGASNGLSFDLYRVRPDGSDLQQITDTAANEYTARWSPDGTQLLFVSDTSTVHNLKVMAADGSHVRWLSTDYVGSADWSPDGKWVIYSGSADSHLYRVNLDGTQRDILVEGFACCAKWSPAVDLPLNVVPLVLAGVIGVGVGIMLSARLPLNTEKADAPLGVPTIGSR